MVRIVDDGSDVDTDLPILSLIRSLDLSIVVH